MLRYAFSAAASEGEAAGALHGPFDDSTLIFLSHRADSDHVGVTFGEVVSQSKGERQNARRAIAAGLAANTPHYSQKNAAFVKVCRGAYKAELPIYMPSPGHKATVNRAERRLNTTPEESCHGRYLHHPQRRPGHMYLDFAGGEPAQASVGR